MAINKKKLVSLNLFERQITALKKLAKNRGCGYGEIIREAIDSMYPPAAKEEKQKA